MGHIRQKIDVVWHCSIASGADAALADADGYTSLHKAAQQASLLLATLPATCLLVILHRNDMSIVAKDEYYNTLTLKLERKMQKFDLRPSPY